MKPRPTLTDAKLNSAAVKSPPLLNQDLPKGHDLPKGSVAAQADPDDASGEPFAAASVHGSHADADKTGSDKLEGGKTEGDKTESGKKAEGEANWTRVKTRLRAELGEDVYSSWFSSAMFEERSANAVVLSVATRFLKHWIEHNFGKRLLSLWTSEDGSIERIRIFVRTGAAPRVQRIGKSTVSNAALTKSVVSKPLGGVPANTNVSATPSSLRDGAAATLKTVTPRPAIASRPGPTDGSSDHAGSDQTGTQLDVRYTFDTFAVGESNKFAYRAATELAREGSVLGCKLLFVRGGVGLGKTHLCQAIASELQARKRTLYLTAEKFMRDFVISLRARSAVDYKEALAAIDVLVVDDIQFLSGQTIQGEFCHVINTLIDAGKTLVVAADRPPAALDTIDARMQSRLSSGLVVEIAAMDRMVRRALLDRRRAAYASEGGRAEVSDAVLDKVADLITTNGRDLEGAFNRIIAEIGLNNVPVKPESVVACINFLLTNAEAPRVKIEDIQRATAIQFGLTKTDLLSQRRTKQIVGPRQIAMYLSKVMTVRSLPDIGKRFGGRDHTTVLHAVRKIEKELESNPSLQKTIEALKSTILSQS
ncbi:MAG: chromosomal replication initiator protein DnaA [Pseudomonadota bacterium]